MTDILILNNCPSFYKINLYKELAKHRKIFVVFSGLSDQVVYKIKFEANFDYIILNEFQVEKRNVIKDLCRIWKIYRKIKPAKVIYGGYIFLEYLFLAVVLPKQKNVLQTESGMESSLSGIKFYLKKMILKRFQIALASGSIHAKVLRKMGFSGEIKITHGVGMINKTQIDSSSKIQNQTPKFLYVGRLIELKNLLTLIKVFNENGLPLTIVGTGLLELELKNMAKPNISFLGKVANEKLGSIYNKHDVLILPSFSEPWGLVLEEALHHDCALLVSNRVSSHPELIVQPQTGVVFDPYSPDSMKEAIIEIQSKLEFFKNNAKKFTIEEKDKHQVSTYINL